VYDVNLLAKQMRERALRIEGSVEPVQPIIEERIVNQPSEEQKKLYFNAGRWSAGARDWTARQAYEQLMGEGEI